MISLYIVSTVSLYNFMAYFLFKLFSIQIKEMKNKTSEGIEDVKLEIKTLNRNTTEDINTLRSDLQTQVKLKSSSSNIAYVDNIVI